MLNRLTARARATTTAALAAVASLVLGTSAAAFEVQCGVEGGDAFGWAIASGANFGADSMPDIAVGAPCAWVGSSIRAGRVKVYSGKDGRVLLSLAGTDPEQRFGAALDFLPDLDGDGKAELVIGSAQFAAPKPGGGVFLGAGKVEVRSSKGGTLWTAFGANANANFGETLEVIADVTGDGKSEVAVGASGAQVAGVVRGVSYLLSGATGAPIAQSNGTDEGGLWASLVGSAGDVNGDGKADWFASSRISALGDDGFEAEGVSTTTTSSVTSTTNTPTTTLRPRAGRLEVLSGKAPFGVLQTYYGETLKDRLGRAAASAGDVDGDSLGDLWIGSPGAEPSMLEDAGVIALYSGDGSLVRQITEPAPEGASGFGTSLVVPGSLDGGTVNDVVAGAPLGRVSGKNQAGRVHAFSGEDGSWRWTRSGTQAFGRFGQTLADGIDFDRDGVQDVIVGAPGDSPAGKRGAGSVVVLSGDENGKELASFMGRRGRETRLFVAGPDLSRAPTVRSYDPSRRRREAQIRPFRGQDSSLLSLTILNDGRREETQNGTKTLLAVGTGRGGAKPEIAVYRATRRKQRISRFAAGPAGYTGGVNIAGGNLFSQTGDEIGVVPADAHANNVLLSVWRAAFVDPFGHIDWTKVREFPVFEATDEFEEKLINAEGANIAAGDLLSNEGEAFDELVVAPVAGLPVVRVFGRAGTMLHEWLAYPSPGQGLSPNSGVSVAVGDLDGQKRQEIVTAPATSGQLWVRARNADGSEFEYAPGKSVNFFVNPSHFGALFSGGLTVATADVDLDGRAEIIVAPGAGTVARILAFEADGSLVEGWVTPTPFGPLAKSGLGLLGLDHFWRP